MTLRSSFSTASAALALLLSGCAIGNVGSVTAPSSPVAAEAHVTGVVHGGQQPVSGAAIQLYAVGNTGNKSAATPLIASTVLTTAAGNFTIDGLWNCTNTAVYGNDPLIYLVATGGNPGLGAGGSNPAISAMAALGPCSTLTASRFISVNELTTVASVFALAPFMSDYTHVGAANMAGLAAAFATVDALVNTASGKTPGTNVVAGETVPTTVMNTLADAMAACINSNGSGSCDTLFAAATPMGGSKPADTLNAFVQIAHAPAQGVAAIFSLVLAAAPFQPVLMHAPTDWTLALNFTGSGIAAPTGVAIDASGNAWIANAGGGSVTGLTGQGVPLTGPNGYSGNGTIYGAQSVAVDRSGNVWFADTLLSTAVKLTVVNSIVQSSASYSSALNGPAGVAIDGQNHAWFANFGDGSVSELDSDGTPLGGSPFNAGGTLQAPAGIAIDAAGNVWVTDNSASVAVEFDKNQKLLSGAGYSDNALVAPLGIGIDAAGNAWIAGNGNSAVSLFAMNGQASASSPVSGGGLAMPSGIALDGAGVAWVTNAGSLSRVTASAAIGALGSLNAPVGLAVDASGNVWTANSGDDSVTKFIGLATPVVTPIAASVGP